jgi:hypothetical protein
VNRIVRRADFQVSSDRFFSESSPVGDLGAEGESLDRQSRLLNLALVIEGKNPDLPYDLKHLEWMLRQGVGIQGSPLSAAEISALSLDLDRVQQQLMTYLAGDLDRNSFHNWACTLIKISVTLELAKEQPEGQKIDSALGLLALLLDDDFASPDSSKRLCRLLFDRLQYRRTVPCRRAVSEMLRELGVAHLTVMARESDAVLPRWVDIALLPRRKNSGEAPHPGKSGWFQPLSISTARLWSQIAPDDRWARPENDRLPALICRQPWLESELEGLQIFLDPGGLAEAVVETEGLQSLDMRKAVAGFRALHQLNRCYLDGIPVHSRKEDL